MNGSITINGEPYTLEDDLEDFTAEFPAADGGEDTIRCDICGQHGQGSVDSPDCMETCAEEDCPDCNGSGSEEADCDRCQGDGHDEEGNDCPDCDGSGYVAGDDCDTCEGSGSVPTEHEWEPISLSWVNSVSVELREGHDEVRFMISVGDPRGAFAFTVVRTDDGRLLMHLPYEGMGAPHVQIKHLHGGTFQLGN